jgi:hypothetical protein
MPKFLDIKSDELIDYTLKLQKINDVALPIAAQNTLNSVVVGVKFKYLDETTNKMFTIRKRTFFKANSRFTKHKAKEFGYNINRLNAQVGIIKSKKANEKATEQVGNQQTATNIKRSINPLSKKPVRKNVIDVLNKKPEIYSYSDEGGFNPKSYYKKAGRAKKRNAPFIVANRGRGRVNMIKKMNRFKSGKRKGRINMKMLAIGSYIKDGEVKLTKRKPFLNRAAEIAMNNMLEKEFMKEADRQFKRVMKK